MNTLETIYSELTASRKVLDAFIKDEKNVHDIQNAADIMINCLKNGGKIIACGNGGSMCDAMHFASELTGRYRKDRQPIAAIAISDPAHLSCVGNDYGYKEVFARYVEAHGKAGDVLLALSTSGESENVSSAIVTAVVKKGMDLVFITGDTGGFIGSQLPHRFPDENQRFSMINIPHSGTAGRIQECSIIILHILVHLIEKGLGYE
jgi:D-sedoheptulose 7-phosphate isomerase